MEKIPNQSESECKTCGKEFEKPLLTELRTVDTTENYYACPRCLTKVGDIEEEKEIEPSVPDEEEKALIEEVAPPETSKIEEALNCPHFVGYLKKRPRGTPIPEDCLICPKMIECF